MRRAHDIPLLVAANLARWFPPWTVSGEQWSSMSHPAVSGIAVDTLLFSRIGVPLFHRYRVVNRAGIDGAFRGSYKCTCDGCMRYNKCIIQSVCQCV